MKLRLLIPYLMLLLCATSHASLRAQPFIIGGQVVQAGDPITRHVVLIKGKNIRSEFTCTGVVLTTRHILTASHCLGSGNRAILSVHFKLTESGAGEVYRVIGQIGKMEKYVSAEKGWEDIAVLTLEKEIPARYSPVTLADSDFILADQDEVLLTGYGRTNMNGDRGEGIGTLRKVTQNVISANHSDTEIMISIKDRGACSGDSGGPAFKTVNNEFIVVGVASRLTAVDKIPDPRFPKYICRTQLIYTKVAFFKEWLREQTQ